MKFTKATNYALHTMLYLAKEGAKQQPIGVQQLADHQQVSPTYLSKILTKLVKEGLITSSSGANGGYKLRNGWQQLSFFDIIQAIEGKASIFECSLHDEPACIVKRVMEKAEEQMEQELRQTTIASLLEGKSSE
ncbi:transcriptional regulator [Terribacillus saccharophilus]|uniref:RrF2 family transcriptional regulator n=2 Tax=Terribacillus saccharophilus TaxID=361277 RepID=UPI000BA6E1B8|nr:Rrf2 family transcriptional regulator [Terribacillus saccharophilus]PAF19836.1 transcriptional regulator [Terribacillus saccharophilus]PAF21744.1 transcriptional regulator [Terribacillus saccharophilus]PAF37844.1 transcriptional regulator [Terribacillus saccharophilus]